MSERTASRKLIIKGFLLVIAVLITVTSVGLYRIHHFSDTVSKVVDERSVMVTHARHMREAALERAVIVQSLIIANDLFEVEDLLVQLPRASSEYVLAREKLYALELTEEDRVLLDEQHRLSREVGSAQNTIVRLLRDDRQDEAVDRLFNVVLPGSHRAMAMMDEFINRKREANLEAMTRLTHIIEQTNAMYLALGLVGVLFSIGVAIGIHRRVEGEIQRREVIENELRQSELRERTILENIADGLITVDALGSILSTNRTTEQIFGYAEGELQGESLRRLVPHLFEVAGDGDLRVWLEQWYRQVEGVGHESTGRRRDGVRFPLELDVSCIELDSEPVYVVLARDISEKKAAEERLQRFNQELEARVEERTRELAEANEQLGHLATHDPLTGLPNRTLFSEQLGNRLRQAVRHHRRLALLFLDLDGFKAVNDEYGHAVGDKLLQELAVRMRDSIRDEDVLARVGGDEFTVIVGELKQAENATRIAEKLVTTVNEPFHIDGCECRIGTSIGISLYPEHAADPDQLLSMADDAMYAAKAAGKNAYLFALSSSESDI
ncbi:MAG: diguanylate cyclase domain-containing protein [Pseudomonadota bacterium]